MAILVLGLAALAAGMFWASGGFAQFAWWLAGRQRALQDALAGDLAALRAGQGAAIWGIIALCAAYGFLHAVGPGHGKAVIAGAAIGTRTTARRMTLIALAGSLGQACVAIGLVYGGLAVIGASARGIDESAQRWSGPVGAAAAGLIGALLLGRGLGALLRGAQTRRSGTHQPHCGHAHGPDAGEVARATGPGAMLALVAVMAARPCTGAILVLIIAWRMQLAWVGAAAVVAMGLGTAAFTALVAWVAVSGREAAFLSAGSGVAARRLGPWMQLVAGGLLVAGAGLAIFASLAVRTSV